ncbi:hypothetical protein Zmor_008299 [Zophobas morio]|uniref:Odorant receptor n=1 Tax=Zophobas morio TaxID=2755281 RepID=A0AA38J129_9CUCU|nr:hypothetical protein Zmor_008299 [Zophobas morio]
MELRRPSRRSTSVKHTTLENMPTNENSLQGDLIQILKLVSIDFFQIKIILLYLKLVVVITLLLELTQTYLFLQKFEILFLIQYGPSYIVTLFFLLSAFTVPYTTQLITKTFDHIKYWDVENVDPKVVKRIRKEAHRVNLFFVLYLILPATSSILHVIPDPDDVSMFYYFMIIENYFPIGGKFLSWCFRCNFLMICLIMLTPYTQLLYCCKCWKFQTLLLQSALERIEYDFKGNDDLIIVPEVQSEVKRKLISCVKLYINLQTGCLSMVKRIKYLILIYATVGCWLIISLIFFRIYFQEICSGKYPRSIAAVSSTLIMAICGIYTGQDLEDSSSRIFDLLKTLSWYRWNEENRKIYLMFTIVCQKPLRIEFSENMIVGYSLGAEVARTVYSMVSILMQIKYFGN